jgi:hypothetical protein
MSMHVAPSDQTDRLRRRGDSDLFTADIKQLYCHKLKNGPLTLTLIPARMRE